MKIDIRQNGSHAQDTEIWMDGVRIDNVTSFAWHMDVHSVNRLELVLNNVEVTYSQGGESYFAEVYITGPNT